MFTLTGNLCEVLFRLILVRTFAVGDNFVSAWLSEHSVKSGRGVVLLYDKRLKMNKTNRDVLQREVVQLNIESVTGKTFRILISRRERVIDLKEKIEESEGISVSQQHLVWRSLELQNDKTLDDYGIQDGANLRLIPAMRGGPINFRRVQIQDQLPPEFLKMLAETETENPSTGKRPVAVVVVRDGEMLNFFRLLDSDMSLETLSGASVFDIEEDLDHEEEANLRKEEEDRMRHKVNALRKRMDSIAVERNKVDLPKPIPPKLVSQSSLRRIYATKPTVVNQNNKLSTTDPSAIPVLPITSPLTDGASVAPAAPDSSQPSKKKPSLPRQSTDEAGSAHHASLHRASHVLLHDSQRKSSHFSNRAGVTTVLPFPVNQSFFRFGIGGSLPQISSRRTLVSKSRRSSLPGKDLKTKERPDVPVLDSGKRNSGLPDGSEQLMSDSVGSISSSYKALNSYLMLAETFPGGSLFNQPTNDLSAKVNSVSLNSISPLAASAQPLHNADVSHKKVTRCAVCSKKTGLASTYECRCHKSFCATHRYPEAHQCTYDYKGEGRQELKDSNPLVTAPKLPKI